METFAAFTPAERSLFEALLARRVRFLIVGLSAAVLQGANTGTRDIDVWFEDLSDARIGEAVRAAHGIWIAGSFGMRPPQIGGDELGDRLDVVTHADGLDAFEREWERSIDLDVDGLTLRVLSLERVIASKRAAGRPRDLAALPALEEALAAVAETRKP